MVASVMPAMTAVSAMTTAMTTAVATTVAATMSAAVAAFGGCNSRGKCRRSGNHAGCGKGNKCLA